MLFLRTSDLFLPQSLFWLCSTDPYRAWSAFHCSQHLHSRGWKNSLCGNTFRVRLKQTHPDNSLTNQPHCVSPWSRVFLFFLALGLKTKQPLVEEKSQKQRQFKYKHAPLKDSLIFYLKRNWTELPVRKKMSPLLNKAEAVSLGWLKGLQFSDVFKSPVDLSVTSLRLPANLT